ncbi:MAG: hypothetical protein DWP97_06310 [Calditrichaeota bacterium]|nr:MAG: hypothetical protein DWP97_06310 [Calditrichota bacterium]
MPCSDITDALKIQLDADDRLTRYALRKKTCGSDVGRRSLLLKWLKGMKVDDILLLQPTELFEKFPTKSKTWEYLYVKHFLAVKSGLSVMVGQTAGSVNDYCKLDSVDFSEEGTLIYAEIAVEGMTDEIKACGGCNSCGTEEKADSPNFSC